MQAHDARDENWQKRGAEVKFRFAKNLQCIEGRQRTRIILWPNAPIALVWEPYSVIRLLQSDTASSPDAISLHPLAGENDRRLFLKG
jgi:hypothetical protein